MKLECVVVCVDYSDFLNWTLPFNRQLFDKMIVVTAPHDTRTQQICEKWYVECLVTDVFYEDNAPFNKAKGINAGLAKLKKNDWVLHMDADILMPPMSRRILDSMDLETECLYFAFRENCKGFNNFIKFMQYPKSIHEGWIYTHWNLPMLEMGTMINKYVPDKSGKIRGVVPIGYFQMWNPKATGIYTYPEQHKTAARTDMQFGEQWDHRHVRYLPEIPVIHLESEDAGMGDNWKGRKTKPFGRFTKKETLQFQGLHNQRPTEDEQNYDNA